MKDRLSRRAVYRSVLVLFSCLSPLAAWGVELPLGKIRLPEGFSISLFAKGVENARSLAYSPGGILYVGTREAGKVYAVRDENGDIRADRVATVASGLDMPNGAAFRGG